AKDGALNVLPNRCAHRGVQFCRQTSGSTTTFTCPYHQWSYDLTGRLLGVPFRKGVNGRGGMPADFRPSEHGLERLAVHERHGVLVSSRRLETSSAAVAELKTFTKLTLEDPRLLDPVREYPGEATVVMQTLWPNLIVQQQSNTLALRQIVPRDAGTFDLMWT